MPIEILVYREPLPEQQIARANATETIAFTKITSCLGIIFGMDSQKLAAHFVLYSDNYEGMIDTLNAELAGKEYKITVVIEAGKEAKPHIASHIATLNVSSQSTAEKLCGLLGLNIKLPDMPKEQENMLGYFTAAAEKILGQLTALPFDIVEQP